MSIFMEINQPIYGDNNNQLQKKNWLFFFLIKRLVFEFKKYKKK